MKPLPEPGRTAGKPDPAAPGHPRSDEELMGSFMKGSEDAFDALFERYSPALHGYLMRLTRSAAAAEDLLQLTFLSMVKARGRFREGARLKPWLYAIATNAARDWRRRNVPEQLTDQGELPADAAAEPGVARDHGLERQVHAALAQLPEGLRIPILMHRFEGLSMREIAEALGLSETAVKVRAHRGYERLRELLASLKEQL